MRFRNRNKTYKKKKSLRRKYKHKQTRRRYKSRGGGGNNKQIVQILKEKEKELINKKKELEIITELLSILLPFKDNCNELNTILSNTKTTLDSLKTEIKTENGLISKIKDKLNEIDTFFKNEDVKLPLSIKDENFEKFIEDKYGNIEYNKYLDLQDYIISLTPEKEFIQNIVIYIKNNNLATNYDDKYYEKILSSDIVTLKDFILRIYDKYKEEFQKYISLIVENVAKFYTKVNNKKIELEFQITSLENKIKAKPEELNNAV